jgi:hypothetical protein
MHTPRSLFLIVLCLLLTASTASAQARSGESASPPTEALAPFAPFLGLYTFAGDWEGEPYWGTLEIKPAVKGWYVEWIINVHAVREEDGPLDRQLRMLTTWDRFAEQYRIWRFETNNPVPMGGGTARFEGDTFIMEWRTPAPDGTMGTFRNRVLMNGPDEIEIVSEGEKDGGAVEQIGVGTGQRRM